MLRLLWFVFLSLYLVTSSPAEEKLPADRYTQALTNFKARLYVQAESEFRSLLEEQVLKESLRDNCRYWIGECRYARGAWLDAMSEFLLVVSWPGSNKAEAAQLKVALCWQNLGGAMEACTQAQLLLARWPAGEYAMQASKLMRSNCANQSTGTDPSSSK